MKTIGRFKILGLLGKGGMGKVFKVAYPVTRKIAALKLLDPVPVLRQTMGMERLEQVFTREAKAMAGIRHPNVADILDFDRAGNRLFYLMDFFCNHLGTLMGESNEGDTTRIIPVEKAVRYIGQTLNGLSCLHFYGIVHRDIKPANLLITDQDTVKICDFGLSKKRGETLPRHGSIRVGSPFYAAPEQETDPDHVDETADLYAVGVMLHKMLTGSLPGPTAPLPSRVNPDLDPLWDRFIATATAADPARRFASANIMYGALEALDRSWQEKKEKICALPESLDTADTSVLPGTPPPPSKSFPGPLRRTPLKIARKEAVQRFGLDGHLRPARYPVNDFQLIPPDLIRDAAHRLIWQQSGSLFPLDRQAAMTYVDRLNQTAPGGLTHWRLPTIPELLTLLSPLPRGRDHCTGPLFDTRQQWLWSADRCTFTSAWYVNLSMGFVGRNDMTGFYHVRAVCSDAG